MVVPVIDSFADCERAMQASPTLEDSIRIADVAMGLAPQAPQDIRIQLLAKAQVFAKAAQCPNDQVVQEVFQQSFNQKELAFIWFGNILLKKFAEALVYRANYELALVDVIFFLTKPEIYKTDSFYFTPKFSIKLAEYPEFITLHSLLERIPTLMLQGERKEAAPFVHQAVLQLFELPCHLQQGFGLIKDKLQGDQGRTTVEAPVSGS